MQKYKKNEKKYSLMGNEHFEGISIEREMQIATASKKPIEKSMSEIFYTQRKHGVLAETDCRTDRFEMAQNAMTHANNDFKKRIEENLKSKENQKTAE